MILTTAVTKFWFSGVIVWFMEVIVRYSEVIVRFREVIVRFREVIVRFSEVIVHQKFNENSGQLRLNQQPTAAHALRSDQNQENQILKTFAMTRCKLFI
jgi:hypothetical protein